MILFKLFCNSDLSNFFKFFQSLNRSISCWNLMIRRKLHQPHLNRCFPSHYSLCPIYTFITSSFTREHLAINFWWNCRGPSSSVYVQHSLHPWMKQHWRCLCWCASTIIPRKWSLAFYYRSSTSKEYNLTKRGAYWPAALFASNFYVVSISLLQSRASYHVCKSIRLFQKRSSFSRQCSPFWKLEASFYMHYVWMKTHLSSKLQPIKLQHHHSLIRVRP